MRSDKKPPMSDCAAYTTKDFRDLSESEKCELKEKLKTDSYTNMGGVFVARNRIKHEKASDFKKELKACRILAAFGHRVYLLPFDFAEDEAGNKKKSADTLTDDEFLELKETEHSIRSNYKKATEQGKDVMIFVTGKMNRLGAVNEIKREIGNLRKICAKSGKKRDFSGKIYIYLEKEKEMVNLEVKTSGVIIEADPRLGAPPQS